MGLCEDHVRALTYIHIRDQQQDSRFWERSRLGLQLRSAAAEVLPGPPPDHPTGLFNIAGRLIPYPNLWGILSSPISRFQESLICNIKLLTLRKAYGISPQAEELRRSHRSKAKLYNRACWPACPLHASVPLEQPQTSRL